MVRHTSVCDLRLSAVLYTHTQITAHEAELALSEAKTAQDREQQIVGKRRLVVLEVHFDDVERPIGVCGTGELDLSMEER